MSINPNVSRCYDVISGTRTAIHDRASLGTTSTTPAPTPLPMRYGTSCPPSEQPQGECHTTTTTNSNHRSSTLTSNSPTITLLLASMLPPPPLRGANAGHTTNSNNHRNCSSMFAPLPDIALPVPTSPITTITTTTTTTKAFGMPSPPVEPQRERLPDHPLQRRQEQFPAHPSNFVMYRGFDVDVLRSMTGMAGTSSAGNKAVDRPAGRRVAWGGEGKRGRARCMAGASSSAAKRNGGKPHTVQ
eukprot:jgi/Undpi1/5373/HiC_scaffold_2.g00654.m1